MATKERDVATLDAMRLSDSDAIRMMMRRVAAEQLLPFGVKVPAPKTIEAMEELDAGGGERFETPVELFADLDI